MSGPSGASSAPAAEESSSNTWIWIVIALLAAILIGLLVWRRMVAGRTSGWRDRARAAGSKGAELYDEVWSALLVATDPNTLPETDAARDARWRGIVALADSTSAAFETLDQGTPNAAAQTAVTALFGAFGSLRSAISEYWEAPGEETLSAVRERMSEFERALGGLRGATGN